jgi:hypothetical protein
MHCQKRSLAAVLLLTIIAVSPSAWATLISRTTHGTQWSGTAALVSDIMRVTVHQAYLDIEEDLVLAPRGTTPSGDQATLEICGEFSLPSGSAITGVLIWNGSTILKGKLKARADAVAQYEDVVDRQPAPPPRPRDPVMIECVSPDRYNLSVYPVRWGGSRKIRVRYLVPHRYVDGGLAMPLRFPFADQVTQRPQLIQVQFKPTDDVTAILLSDGAARSSVSLPSINFKSYSTDLSVSIPGMPQSVVVHTHLAAGYWQGHYAMFSTIVPYVLRSDAESAGATQISLSIRSENETYNFDVTNASGTFTFAGHSKAVWNSTVQWSLQNDQGDVLGTYQQKLDALSCPKDTGLVKLWAASAFPFSQVFTLGGLGALYGIVDQDYALLALEDDTVGAELQALLADSGLPFLDSSEIFAPDPDAQAPDDNPTVAELRSLRAAASSDNLRVLPDRSGQVTISYRLPDIAGRAVLRIYDSRGRLVARWTREELLSARNIVWNGQCISGALAGKGMFVAVLEVDGRAFTTAFVRI